jgi:hypothetical protein
MSQFKLLLLIVFLFLFLFTESISAKELIREFRGSRSTTTVEFEVRAPWILDWRITTDYPSQMGIDISLVESGTGALLGSVFKI